MKDHDRERLRSLTRGLIINTLKEDLEGGELLTKEEQQVVKDELIKLIEART